MSGNYDVTNVTVRNGIDNSSSFKTGKNGKKVFIGTEWNETSHITNDANQGTIFADGQSMTLKLNSRYKNGGADVYSNLDGRHTGISFDLLDKFIQAAADGVLEDVDHKGYTKENMVAFGKAFDTLREQKLAEAKKDPYAKEYKKMMNGTEFTFSAQELETLYKAAGFDLVKKEGTKPIEIPEVPVVPPTQKEQPVNKPLVEQQNVPPKKPVTEEPEGNERISHNGRNIINDIATALGLPDGEIDLQFDGESLCYENDVLIYAEGKYTLNGQTRKFRIDRTGEQEKVQTKKTGMFRKWHDVEVPEGTTARAEARRGAGRAAGVTDAVATVATENKAQEKLDAYYKANVTDAKFWHSRINVDRDTQDESQFHGSYDQVTSKDGRKLARVTTYQDGKPVKKYYEVKAAVIHSEYGNREYTSIIPDLTKEVTDAEF